MYTSTWGIIVIKKREGEGGAAIPEFFRQTGPTVLHWNALVERIEAFSRGSPHLEKTTGTRRGEHGPRAVYVFPGWWSEIYNWAREEFNSGSGQSREICIWELFHFFLDHGRESNVNGILISISPRRRRRRRLRWLDFWNERNDALKGI